MFLSIALLACCFGGDPHAEPVARPKPMVKYQIRVLDVPGLSWRSEGYGTIQSVARQGAVSIWTAPTSYLEVLKEHACRMVCAPNVCSEPNASASVRFKQIRAIVGGLKRHADGPMGEASAVAFEPEIDQIAECFQATLSGRVMDQGVLTQIAIEDQRIAAIQTYSIAESLKRNPDGQSDQEPQRVIGQAQVPHMVHSRAEGEWLIPHGQLLIVSLGVSFEPGEKDPARVVERLVLVGIGSVAHLEPTDCKPASELAVGEPAASGKWQAVPAAFPELRHPVKQSAHVPTKPLRDPQTLRTSLARIAVVPSPIVIPGQFTDVPPSAPALVQASPKHRIPHVPSRHLPVGVGVKGEHALPPLPTDVEVTAASVSASDTETRPSSQTPHLSPAGAARIIHAVAQACATSMTHSAPSDRAVRKASTSEPAPADPVSKCPHGCTTASTSPQRAVSFSWGQVRLEIQVAPHPSTRR
jgi:hypothetical protein